MMSTAIQQMFLVVISRIAVHNHSAAAWFVIGIAGRYEEKYFIYTFFYVLV